MSTPCRSIKQTVIDRIKHMIDNRIQRRMRSDYDDYDEACRELQNDEVFRPDTEALLTMNEVLLKGKGKQHEND